MCPSSAGTPSPAAPLLPHPVCESISVYHTRSEGGIVCSSVCLFVCLSVCLSVNTITLNRLKYHHEIFRARHHPMVEMADKFENSYIGERGWWFNVSDVLVSVVKSGHHVWLTWPSFTRLSLLLVWRQETRWACIENPAPTTTSTKISHLEKFGDPV